MAKRKTNPRTPTPAAKDDKPATLKDLLDGDTLSKLKARADALKVDAQKEAEARRAQEEAARKAEQKRLENDFGHLLDNSGMDWRKYK
ncbi:YqkE family protein [Cohnella nanjingensis]|uniref:YqkE family protein n=1 Tax=Cohnella nanjingensis TaxID=1387779 RepID=A0A7X0RSL4_9BACL|nr:YqkE family protein [Cohnella nanjingensis]MBB6672748.1 YqkE family protein [Cohnella nanjingensis]